MFDCLFDECPENPKKCHLYWRVPWENKETGETTYKEGCILSQDMGWPLVQSIVRAAHISSEHASVARNSTDELNDTIKAISEYAIQEHERRELPYE